MRSFLRFLGLALVLAGCGESESTLSEEEQCRPPDEVTDEYYAPRSSRPSALAAWNDSLYFSAFAADATTTSRLRRFAGTESVPIEPPPMWADALLGPLTPWDGYLWAFKSSGLWRVGPDDSLTLADELAWRVPFAEFNGAWPAVYADALYFQAPIPNGDAELFRFDGSSSEVAFDLPDGGLGGSYPTHLTVLGEALYFFASVREIGRALYVFDGDATTLERDFSPDDDYPWTSDAIVGVLDDSLGVLTGGENPADRTLLLHAPGAEPRVLDTGVSSAVLVGSSIVYERGGFAVRWTDDEAVELSALDADVSRGVELDGRIYVATTGDGADANRLFEIVADSLLPLDGALRGVFDIAAFGDSLLLSATDAAERYDRKDEELVGHELFRFLPATNDIELAEDLWPGWHYVCVYD